MDPLSPRVREVGLRNSAKRAYSADIPPPSSAADHHLVPASSDALAGVSSECCPCTPCSPVAQSTPVEASRSPWHVGASSPQASKDLMEHASATCRPSVAVAKGAAFGTAGAVPAHPQALVGEVFPGEDRPGEPSLCLGESHERCLDLPWAHSAEQVGRIPAETPSQPAAECQGGPTTPHSQEEDALPRPAMGAACRAAQGPGVMLELDPCPVGCLCLLCVLQSATGSRVMRQHSGEEEGQATVGHVVDQPSKRVRRHQENPHQDGVSLQQQAGAVVRDVFLVPKRDQAPDRAEKEQLEADPEFRRAPRTSGDLSSRLAALVHKGRTDPSRRFLASSVIPHGVAPSVVSPVMPNVSAAALRACVRTEELQERGLPHIDTSSMQGFIPVDPPFLHGPVPRTSMQPTQQDGSQVPILYSSQLASSAGIVHAPLVPFPADAGTVTLGHGASLSWPSPGAPLGDIGAASFLPRDMWDAPLEVCGLSDLDDLPWLPSELLSDLGLSQDTHPGTKAFLPAGNVLLGGGGGDPVSSSTFSLAARGLVLSSSSTSSECSKRGSPESLEVGSTSASGQGQTMALRSLSARTRARLVADAAEEEVDMRLKKRLLALAEAVATKDEMQASIFTRLLEADTSPEGSPMQRIGYYFLEALKMRKRGEGMGSSKQLTVQDSQVGNAVLEFVRALPYVEFWEVGMNCAMVDAAAGKAQVHILDFGMWQGQWARLFRHLQTAYVAEQTERVFKKDSGDSPEIAVERPRLRVRFTAVALPPDCARGTGPFCEAGDLQVEVMLAAAEVGVECHFEAIQSSLEDFTPELVGYSGRGPGHLGGCMRDKASEALVVCVSTHLYTLPDSAVLRSNPRDTFLRKLAWMSPDVLVSGSMEADFNIPFFLRRFHATLDLYSKLFRSFDLGASRSSFPRRMFEERIMVPCLTNLVTCDGAMLHLRCEGVAKTRHRMRSVGLEPRPQSVHAGEMLNSMLLKYPPGFSIRACCRGGGGILSWEGSDLASYTAWKPMEFNDEA